VGLITSAALERVTHILRESAGVKTQIIASPAVLQAIVRAAEAMVQALVQGNKLLFFGNGGSAADAQHLTAEFTGRFVAKGRRPLPAMSLTANTSSLTAIANDFAFEDIFARQLQALGQSGDVAIGISTSGRSPNVLKAVTVAKAARVTTIGLTGGDGGPLRSAADIVVVVPSHDTQRIQEAHIVIGHVWCELVEHAYLAQSR